MNIPKDEGIVKGRTPFQDQATITVQTMNRLINKLFILKHQGCCFALSWDWDGTGVFLWEWGGTGVKSHSCVNDSEWLDPLNVIFVYHHHRVWTFTYTITFCQSIYKMDKMCTCGRPAGLDNSTDFTQALEAAFPHSPVSTRRHCDHHPNLWNVGFITQLYLTLTY